MLSRLLLVISNVLNFYIAASAPVGEIIVRDWQTVGNYNRKTLSGKKYGQRYK